MSREKIIDVMAKEHDEWGWAFSQEDDVEGTDSDGNSFFYEGKVSRRKRMERSLTALEAAGYAIENAAELTRLRSDLEKATEALKQTEPILAENYRWHRDMQSAIGNICKAHEVLVTVRCVLSQLEKV